MNPYLSERMSKDHRNDLLRAARRWRQTESSPGGSWDRWWGRVRGSFPPVPRAHATDPRGRWEPSTYPS